MIIEAQLTVKVNMLGLRDDTVVTRDAWLTMLGLRDKVKE